jgi:hypothetical protein
MPLQGMVFVADSFGDGLESKHRMSQQPNLFSPQAPGNLPPQIVAGAPKGAKSPRSTPPWLQRLDFFVRVIVRLYLGLIILVLPWPWLRLWDENRLLVVLPYLAPVFLNGITRGLVSGLGLLNIWIAIHDAIHHREG